MSTSNLSLPGSESPRLYNDNDLHKGNACANLQKDAASEMKDMVQDIKLMLLNIEIVRMNATKIRDWEKVVPLWKNVAGSGWKLPTYFPQNISELRALKYNPKDSCLISLVVFYDIDDWKHWHRTSSEINQASVIPSCLPNAVECYPEVAVEKVAAVLGLDLRNFQVQATKKRPSQLPDDQGRQVTKRQRHSSDTPTPNLTLSSISQHPNINPHQSKSSFALHTEDPENDQSKSSFALHTEDPENDQSISTPALHTEDPENDQSISTPALHTEDPENDQSISTPALHTEDPENDQSVSTPALHTEDPGNDRSISPPASCTSCIPTEPNTPEIAEGSVKSNISGEESEAEGK